MRTGPRPAGPSPGRSIRSSTRTTCTGRFRWTRRGTSTSAGRPPDSLGLDDIYLARFVGGKYEKPVNLGGPDQLRRRRDDSLHRARRELSPVFAAIRPLGQLPGRRRSVVRTRQAWPRGQQPGDRALPGRHGRRKVSVLCEQPRRRKPRLVGPGRRPHPGARIRQKGGVGARGETSYPRVHLGRLLTRLPDTPIVSPCTF